MFPPMNILATYTKLKPLSRCLLCMYRAAVGHFSNVNFQFFFSYNCVFVAFWMQWEPNGNLIGPVKLKMGTFGF